MKVIQLILLIVVVSDEISGQESNDTDTDFLYDEDMTATMNGSRSFGVNRYKGEYAVRVPARRPGLLSRGSRVEYRKIGRGIILPPLKITPLKITPIKTIQLNKLINKQKLVLNGNSSQPSTQINNDNGSQTLPPAQQTGNERPDQQILSTAQVHSNTSQLSSTQKGMPEPIVQLTDTAAQIQGKIPLPGIAGRGIQLNVHNGQVLNDRREITPPVQRQPNATESQQQVNSIGNSSQHPVQQSQLKDTGRTKESKQSQENVAKVLATAPTPMNNSRILVQPAGINVLISQNTPNRRKNTLGSLVNLVLG